MHYVRCVPYSYLCGISWWWFILERSPFFFTRPENFEIFMGLIYPFMLCMCAAGVCVCVCTLCARFYCRGILTWPSENKGVRLFSCNFIRSGRFHYGAKMVVCGFSCCITLQYVSPGGQRDSGRASVRLATVNAQCIHWHKLTENDRQIDIWPHLTIKNYRSNSIPFAVSLSLSPVFICLCSLPQKLHNQTQCTEFGEQVNSHSQIEGEGSVGKKNKQRIILPPLSLDTIFSMFFLFFRFECYCYRCVVRRSLPFLV